MYQYVLALNICNLVSALRQRNVQVNRGSRAMAERGVLCSVRCTPLIFSYHVRQDEETLESPPITTTCISVRGHL